MSHFVLDMGRRISVVIVKMIETFDFDHFRCHLSHYFADLVLKIVLDPPDFDFVVTQLYFAHH
ncbi:hypothetical protein ACEUVP_08935 [Staphylococcus pseudintermedius]